MAGTVDFLVVFEGTEDDDETKTGEWYWRGMSDNREIVDRGEGHPNYSNALRAAKGAHPGKPVFKINEEGEKVPVGVHATDRYSEIKSMLGIPDSEPIFILRGQDKLAAETVNEYRYFAEDARDELSNADEWLTEIADTVAEFSQFARKNPDKMKFPD